MSTLDCHSVEPVLRLGQPLAVQRAFVDRPRRDVDEGLRSLVRGVEDEAVALWKVSASGSSLSRSETSLERSESSAARACASDSVRFS